MDFDEIYRTYFRDVYRYILRLSGNEDIAEEITAETFFKAMNSIERFRGECSIRVWLCQIAKNSYFSYIKRCSLANQEKRREIFVQDLSETVVEEYIIKINEAEYIRGILHSIPEPYKEVFMWRVFAELTFKQIGDLFKKSENWACVTYYRARKKIMEKMGEEENAK